MTKCWVPPSHTSEIVDTTLNSIDSHFSPSSQTSQTCLQQPACLSDCIQPDWPSKNALGVSLARSSSLVGGSSHQRTGSTRTLVFTNASSEPPLKLLSPSWIGHRGAAPCHASFQFKYGNNNNIHFQYEVAGCWDVLTTCCFHTCQQGRQVF